MTLVGLFVYCARCRKVLNLAQAVPCELTGRWRCVECEGEKVSA